MIETAPGNLVLLCETQNDYSCANYNIRTTLNIKNDKIEIKFKDIYKPEFCLTAIGPASVALDLKKLSGKTYDMVFYHNKRKITGQLTVTAEGYNLEVESQKKIEIKNTYLSKGS